MAIEISPRIETKIKKSLWAILFVVFSALVALSLLLSYLYFKSAAREVQAEIIQKEKLLAKTSAEKALEDKVKQYETKINAFKKIFSEHKKILSVFEFIERNTHPDVWFESFQWQSKSLTMQLSGKTNNLDNVGQQLIIFRKQRDVLKGIRLSQVDKDEETGLVDFSLEITFNSKILNQ